MDQVIERMQSPQIHAAMLVLSIVVIMLWYGRRIREQGNDNSDDEE